MAKPAPCMACLDVPDADYLWSNRLDGPWPFDQSTVALCLRCFLEAVDRMAAAYAQAMAELQDDEHHGVLDEIEADEGKVEPVRIQPKSKRQKPQTEEPVTVPEAPTQESEAAHDHG